jgi:hypothetical protein
VASLINTQPFSLKKTEAINENIIWAAPIDIKTLYFPNAKLVFPV